MKLGRGLIWPSRGSPLTSTTTGRDSSLDIWHKRNRYDFLNDCRTANCILAEAIRVQGKGGVQLHQCPVQISRGAKAKTLEPTAAGSTLHLQAGLNIPILGY